MTTPEQTNNAAVGQSDSNALLGRTLTCPFCGHTARDMGIGAVYCGPHKVADLYSPAVRMRSVFDDEVVSNV